MNIDDVRDGLRVHMVAGDYTGKFFGIPATMTGRTKREFHPDCDGGTYWTFAEVVFDPFPWYPDGERRFVTLRTLAPVNETA